MTGAGFGKVLLRRAQALGERRARQAAARLAGRIGETIAGVRAEADGDAVRLQGRSLRRRALIDPQLRWLGRWLR